MFENKITNTQEIRHLQTQSLYEWCAFFSREIVPAKITSMVSSWYTETYVVKCSEDFIFMSSISSENQIKIQDTNEFFYLIVSSGEMTGRNGEFEKTLPLGGGLLFDGRQSISLKIKNEQNVICLLFPYSYFGHEDYIKKIIGLNKVLHNHFIFNLIKSMHYSDSDLSFKMKAIANLLLSNEKKQTLTREDYDLSNIVNIINYNILSNKLNLDFISSSLGMSKSKIQKILSKSKMTYSQRIKIARVEALAWKIKHYKYKTLFELCYACGFNSVSNAAVQFKKVKGISISQYKQNLKIEEEYHTHRVVLNN